MTINDLLPSVATLSHADKFRLVQIVLEQLAMDDSLQTQQHISRINTFNPRDFFGVAHQSRQEVDEYLASSREGWN